ncbi:hypothetical protein ACFL2V_04405 [Pseudomonadota bacterium]
MPAEQLQLEEQPISEESYEVAQRYKEMLVNPPLVPDQPPPTIVEHMRFVREFLGVDFDLNSVLTDKTIKRILDGLEMRNKLRDIFPEGYLFGYTIVGCNEYGHPLEGDEIQNELYLVPYEVEVGKDPATGQRILGETTSDYLVERPHYLHYLQPQEIQKDCTFEVGILKEEQVEGEFGPYDMHPNDRTRIISEVARILKNLQMYWQRELATYQGRTIN